MTRDQFLAWSRTLARYLFFPALCLVIWGELRSVTPLMVEDGSDKILHFTAYFGLAAMVTVALNATRRTWLALLALVVLGGLLEILQGLTGRDAEWLDEVANMVGVLFGWGAGLVWLKLSTMALAVRGARP